MENTEQHDELYETEVDEEILHEGMMVKMNKDSDDGEREECFEVSDSASEFVTSDTAHSSIKCEPSEELSVQQEMAEEAFLDSVFGELPPKSLIKTNLLFAKPAHPKGRPQTKWYPPFVNEEMFVADRERPQEANTDVLEKGDKYGNVRKRFVRMGGMLAMPVPVPGPLFTGKHLTHNPFISKNGKLPPDFLCSLSYTSLSGRTRMPFLEYSVDQDTESYKLIQSSWNTLSFSLDFPKPPRPGTKARSKPSDLQTNKVTKQDKLKPPSIQIASETSAFQLLKTPSQLYPEVPTQDPSQSPAFPGSFQEPLSGISPQPSQDPMPGPNPGPSLGLSKSHKGFFKLFSLPKKKKSSPTLATNAAAVSTFPSIANETKSHPGLIASSSTTEAASKKIDLIIFKKQGKSQFPHAEINSKASTLQLSTSSPEFSSKAPVPALPETPTTKPSKPRKGFLKLCSLPRTKKPPSILASKAVSVSTFPSTTNETKSPPALIDSSSTTQATSEVSSPLVNASIAPSSLEVTAVHLAPGQTVIPELSQPTLLLSTISVKSSTDTQAITSISDPSEAATKDPGESTNFKGVTSTVTPGEPLQKKAVSRSAPLPGAKWVQKLF